MTQRVLILADDFAFDRLQRQSRLPALLLQLKSRINVRLQSLAHASPEQLRQCSRLPTTGDCRRHRAPVAFPDSP